jgi:DNA polymerase I-like protein with 3'-5' exonuclease and polymerase domains
MVKKDYTIINDKRSFQKALQHAKQSEYLAFDTETTGLNVRKDKVIGYSFSGDIGVGFYMPLYYYDPLQEKLLRHPVNDQVDHQELLFALANQDLLMWNASFDVRMVKNNFGIDLGVPLLADVMLMKHTVEEEGSFRLKDVAIQYQEEIGLDIERAANEEQIELKASIEKNGGSVTKTNYELYKGDLDIIGKYACADTDLTLRLGELFADKLADEDLEELYYDSEVMPLYKEVTIKMEEKGIELDLDLINETRESLLKDIDRLESEVIEDLMATEAAQDWFEDFLYEKYPVSTKGKFGQYVCEYFNLDLPKTKSGKFSLTEKSIKTIKTPNDGSDFLLGLSDLDQEDIYEIQYKMHMDKQGSILNISSKKQLGEVVFDYMNIEPISKTDKGSPQFNDTMIQKLEEMGFEWARKLGNYNKLIKIKGAYIDRFLDAEEDGMFYPSFFQHRTISGRYGSDMQQLPRPKEEGEQDPIVLKYTNIIRKFFISGEGRTFIDNDYESLEPHVFAHVSGDEGLRDIFRKGHDFYSTIAIATEGLEGVSADKKAENYLGKVNKPLRQKAKAYSLGVPYGMKGFALGMTLGIPTEEADKLIENYLNGFPELKKWMKESEEKAQHLGYVDSEVGRKRHLPEVKRLHRIYGSKLLDYKYRPKLNKKFGKDVVLNMYRDYKNGLNNAKNFQIQSLSASIVNMAAIEINRELDKRGIDGWVALQIHDQLVVNVPEERAEECRELVQDIMENNYKLSLDLKAPAELSTNLADGH